MLTVVAATLAGAALLPLGLAAMPHSQAMHALGALRATWSLVFLTAGVLHLVRWRVTGETRAGLRGAGTVALGALTAPTTALAPMLSVRATDLSPLTRTVAVVACLALLTRAAGSPAIDTRARPLRSLILTLGGGWLFIASMVVLATRRDAVDAGPDGWFAIELAMTAGWLLCATTAGRRASTDRSASFVWMSTGCGLMACAEASRALAFVATPDWQFVATGIQLVAASLVLLNAMADLTALLSAESRLVQMLSGAVRDTEQQLSADERTESARRHEARAVLAALRASSSVLDRYDETLDRETRAELLASFAGELSRLEQMIDRRTSAALETFAVDSAVGPAVRSVPSAQLLGDLPSFAVYGRAIELRGLVENVLDTLSRQAPDGKALLRVTRSTSGVQVICEAARDATAEPSQVGADDVSVRNLRLQVARRMMREQGGDVVVSDGYGSRVSVALWLRQAPEAPSVEGAPPGRREPSSLAARLEARPIGRAS